MTESSPSYGIFPAGMLLLCSAAYSYTYHRLGELRARKTMSSILPDIYANRPQSQDTHTSCTNDRLDRSIYVLYYTYILLLPLLPSLTTLPNSRGGARESVAIDINNSLTNKPLSGHRAVLALGLKISYSTLQSVRLDIGFQSQGKSFVGKFSLSL